MHVSCVKPCELDAATSLRAEGFDDEEHQFLRAADLRYDGQVVVKWNQPVEAIPALERAIRLEPRAHDGALVLAEQALDPLDGDGVGNILSHERKKPSGIFQCSRNWSTVNIRDERKKIPLAVFATTSVWVCNSRQWAVKCWHGRGRRGWGARFQPIGSWKMCIHKNSFKVLISRF